MLKGINHFNHNGYINALKCFEKSAKGDNECALLLSASIYYMGFNGVTRNTRKAFDYFKKVATKWKNPIGQYYVGVMLLTGEAGSEQKKEEAIEWLTLAAEGGWNSAQAAVGLVYYGGLGVEKDYKKATTWFNKAVQADNKLNGCDNETYESEDLVVYLFNNKRFRLKVDLKAKQLLDEYDVSPDVEDGDVSGFNLYQEASTDTQNKSRIEAMFWYSMTGAPYLKGVCQLTPQIFFPVEV
ncbi:uncharacterized protein EV154DRAFT_560483 [Mucor mucedo]|uniref:uncharacterized protein n=1 Tax=Mucor mucedo TaxID=29922 RepID=UPI00221E7EAF|nr:uncharacterized protein EV154DRAFT_560483 [Mucor mucedo]KAI7894258.1 hypothetical protein EV154DRAFT_560483 [Mucor mucedo]